MSESSPNVRTFWLTAPICGEAVVDHGASQIVKTATGSTPVHAVQAATILSDRLWDRVTVQIVGFIGSRSTAIR